MPIEAATVSIRFTGDLSDVRAQYTNFLQEMRQKTAAIQFTPAQAIGGGGNGNSNGNGGYGLGRDQAQTVGIRADLSQFTAAIGDAIQQMERLRALAAQPVRLNAGGSNGNGNSELSPLQKSAAYDVTSEKETLPPKRSIDVLAGPTLQQHQQFIAGRQAPGDFV